MMLERFKLRALVESVLLEGFKDDQRYLIDKYSAHAADLDGLSPKWIAWLTARFGKNPTRSEIHPFEDSIVTVVKFARLDSGLNTKYRSNPQFMSDVDEQMPPGERDWRDWSDPSQSVKITVDELELIMGLSERKKENFKVEVSEEEMESDRIGKVGPWNLWMPTTRERSCKIAGYDPVTRKPHTTWCTARMAGSNLFYSYVGRPRESIILFYVIRDNPRHFMDWLSVGFVNGRPVLTGQRGGVSVNKNNDGLTQESLREVLGPHHDEIVRTLEEKSQSLGGKHPAKDKVKAAAKDPKALEYLLKGLSDEERDDIVGMVAAQPRLSSETVLFLANSPKPKDRRLAASKKQLPIEGILKLADDPDERVRIMMAGNESCPPEILTKLANDPNVDVRSRASMNPNLPASELIKIVSSGNERAIHSALSNPNMPPEVANIISRSPDWVVRHSLASRRMTPNDVLERLSDDPDSRVRGALVANPNISPEIMLKLSKDPQQSVRMNVAYSEKTSDEILNDLLKDQSPDVRDEAKKNIKKRLKKSQAKKLNERRLRQLIRRML
jgi:hypothetical protein